MTQFSIHSARFNKEKQSLVQGEHDQLQSSKKKTGQAALKTRIAKEAKAIPNLIFKIEMFETEVIKLGKRCKVFLKLTDKKLLA